MRMWLLLLAFAPGIARAASYLPFTDYLPPLVFSAEEYQSGYNHYCRDDQGHLDTYRCVDKVIRQMTQKYNGLHATCSHRGLFALAYLRTTEEYQRASLEPGFFTDPEFVNHEDVVFARMYFDARDHYDAGRLDRVPPAWRVAFETADARSVTTIGDVMLGISAHINRDLPFTLATIGLVDPVTGQSRKPDHDRVNEFLSRVYFDDEVRAYWDPSFSSGPPSSDLPNFALAAIQLWRENAWRNAELLIAAQTPAEQALVIENIEVQAYQEAIALKTSFGYPPGQSSASRDAFCHANN